MKVFIYKVDRDLIELSSKADDESGLVFDLRVDLRPGESLFGIKFDKWVKWEWAVLKDSPLSFIDVSEVKWRRVEA